MGLLSFKLLSERIFANPCFRPSSVFCNSTGYGIQIFSSGGFYLFRWGNGGSTRSLYGLCAIVRYERPVLECLTSSTHIWD